MPPFSAKRQTDAAFLEAPRQREKSLPYPGKGTALLLNNRGCCARSCSQSICTRGCEPARFPSYSDEMVTVVRVEEDRRASDKRNQNVPAGFQPARGVECERTKVANAQKQNSTSAQGAACKRVNETNNKSGVAGKSLASQTSTRVSKWSSVGIVTNELRIRDKHSKCESHGV